jgi:hypothetical protein
LAGYLLGACSLWQRGFLIVAALGLVKPGLATDIAGAIVVGAVMLNQALVRRARDSATARSLDLHFMLGVAGLLVGLVGGIATRPGGAASISLDALVAALETPSRETWPMVQGTVAHILIVSLACALVGLAIAYTVGRRRTEIGPKPGA